MFGNSSKDKIAQVEAQVLESSKQLHELAQVTKDFSFQTMRDIKLLHERMAVFEEQLQQMNQRLTALENERNKSLNS